MSPRTLILLLALPLSAVAGELAASSPFGAALGAPGSEAARETLELRGVMATDAGVRYCIFDTQRNRGTWAAVSDAGPGFVIRSADPAAGRVVLEAGGRIRTLALREGRVRPATPEGNAPMRSIAFIPQGRRQPGEPRAPRLP